MNLAIKLVAIDKSGKLGMSVKLNVYTYDGRRDTNERSGTLGEWR